MTTANNVYIDINKDEVVFQKVSELIQSYKDGKILTNTLQFQFFVMCATQVIKRDQFYELPMQQISEYIRAVQVFTTTEIITVVQMLVSHCRTQKQADLSLKKILPSIRCTHQTYNLSPCCCESLYKFISRTQCKLKNGDSYHFGNLFDFQSDQMLKMRSSQEKFPNPPQFIHTDDTCLVICHNDLANVYNQLIQPDEDPPVFDKDTARPTNYWDHSIASAISTSNLKSIQYDLFLLPILRNLRLTEGNSPVHIAVESNQLGSMSLLKKFKSNFNIFNDDGNMPIHIVKNKETLERLIGCGCSIYDLNKKGQTLIEIMSNPFNEDIIRYLFKKGYDLFQPLSKGQYWGQIVVNNKYFSNSDDNYFKFQKFLRYVLSNYESSSKIYKENKTLQNILKKKSDINETNDIKCLRQAVLNRDMNEIKTYIALGTPPDTFIDDDKGEKLTNLMIASRNGDIELVQLFVNNFCDPNKVNQNGENSFWISAWNNYFDISTLLQTKFNADPNILSNTGQTLVHVAYDKKMEELFYYLLDLGASPNIPNIEGETIQFKTFLNRDDKVAEIIQDDYNGDINALNKEGLSLGHIAVLNNDQERLEYLFSRNFQIETKDNKNHSLFMSSILREKDCNYQICQFLLDHGSDINATDNEGNTSFYLICSEKVNFDRKKFDFLLKNNCDINIVNNVHDLPFSQLLNFERKEEISILIDKKVNVNDCESLTEPICLALKKHDQLLFEKLINECGSNAMNKKFPVIEKYLEEESFFNFETLKKMKSFNSTVGAPIQLALRTKRRDVALFLWKNATENDRILISKSLDKNHQTPLMTAIFFNDEEFINELVNPLFDLSTPDKVGRSPLISVCIKKMDSLMNKIAENLSYDQINIIDRGNDSALSIVAKNNNKKFADFLFIKGANVTGINFDDYGIIQNYSDLLNAHNDLINKAAYNLAQAKDKLDKAIAECQKLDDEIKSFEIRFNLNQNSISNDTKKESFNEYALRNKKTVLQEACNNRQLLYDTYNKFAGTLNYIQNIPRHEILYNLGAYYKFV